MTTLMITILGFAIVLAIAMRTPRRSTPEHTGLIKAMNLIGINPADAQAAGEEHALLLALDRCPKCAFAAQCAASLFARGGGKLPEACPSRSLIADIAQHKAAQPVLRRSLLADFAGVDPQY